MTRNIFLHLISIVFSLLVSMGLEARIVSVHHEDILWSDLFGGPENRSIGKQIPYDSAYVFTREALRRLNPEWAGGDLQVFHLGPVSSKEFWELKFLEEAKKWCPNCQFHLKVNFPNIDLLIGEHFSWVPLQKTVRGKFVVPVEAVQREKTQTLWVTGELLWKRNVFVSKRSLQKNQKVRGEDFYQQLRDVTYIREALPEALKGYIAHHVSAGAILTSNDIQGGQRTVRGERVKIISVSNGFRLEISGEARSEGAVGDLIEVFNPRTKKVHRGVLVKRGVVRL